MKRILPLLSLLVVTPLHAETIGWQSPVNAIQNIQDAHGGDISGEMEDNQTDSVDPWESLNRKIFSFNNMVNDNVLTPIDDAYRYVVPHYGRDRVHNVFSNLQEPVRALNSLLEGDLTGTVDTMNRFVFNSLFGVLGIWDVSTDAGLPVQDRDFGMTLASWGVGSGPYLVLPLLGPSTVRDTAGLAVASMVNVNPATIYMSNNNMTWGNVAYTMVNGFDDYDGNIDTLKNINRTALDPYSSLRSVWMQHRQSAIKRYTGDKP